ncbi:MlaA family lipoprotein [Terricaulis silvestris]|uniref:Putative phospholipid-binding lipoprotein MlaA n=1 Tax=Terricaulis silvestris TaxID=2686094 RepID=A0A6I6ML29_9CAUL|nr:VacJ family lipoprotein [Terricaulis silvestris]QGZ96075.1 putative phospholipid-binding lipoprotein MlaA precursor [Terricaulis silvestris]
MRGLISALSFAACLATPALAHAQEAGPADPWEGFNRQMFAIHEGVDKAVLEPVARGYRAITPRPVRQGVLNLLRNLRGPVIFANDVLQGEFSRAGTTAVRFGVNSTIGIAGIFDPATSMGLDRHDEDFGQTLAVWGVDSGPYLFIPLMGPTTLRDGAGSIVDVGIDPLTYADFDEADDVRIARVILSGVAARELVLDTVDDIRRDSLDPYVTIRTSYGLLRESAIQNGPADVEDLPEFEDIDEQPATPGDVDAPSDNGVTGDNSQQVGAIQNEDATVTLAETPDAPTSKKRQKPSGEQQ